MALLRDSHSPVQKQPCNFLHLNWMYQPTSPCELTSAVKGPKCMVSAATVKKYVRKGERVLTVSWVELALSSMKKLVSLRFTVSTYCRMTPFWPSYGGGSQDRVAVRDVTPVTVRLAGGAVGTAKEHGIWNIEGRMGINYRNGLIFSIPYHLLQWLSADW